MDRKGFERLQTAVQFAVDEDRMERAKESRSTYTWRQGYWGVGWLTNEVVHALIGGRKAKNPYRVVCPTAGCVAGTIVVQHGDKLVAETTTDKETGLVQADNCVDDAGVYWTVESRANDLLGLDDDQTCRLFSGGLGIDDVVQAASQIAKDHGYELEVV